MRKHLWADSTKEWDGFLPTAYSLDSEKVWRLPLTQGDPKEGKLEKVSTTVGNVYESLANQQCTIDPTSFRVVRIVMNGEELEFTGPSFSCHILRELLQLKKDGVEPFSALWFWYDSDSRMDDPHETYSFFVVAGDKIVREEVSLSDYGGSGFDPTVFDSGDDSNPIWMNEAGWLDARKKFWYRKFYSETRTGQLMVLRSDEPILHHYEEGLRARDPDRELEVVTQVKTYRLLWVAFPLLVALAFPALKAYMAIAAAALGANFLLFCWTTRKLGRP